MFLSNHGFELKNSILKFDSNFLGLIHFFEINTIVQNMIHKVKASMYKNNQTNNKNFDQTSFGLPIQESCSMSRMGEVLFSISGSVK